MKRSFWSLELAITNLMAGGFLALALTGGLQARPQSRPRISAKQPYAYLFPAKLDKLTEHLQRQDIEVCELREDIELDVQVHRIRRILYGRRQREGQRTVRLRTRAGQQTKRFPAGTILVKTDQKSKEQIGKLLAPSSTKSREVFKLLGRLSQWDDYPIVKLNSYVPITHGPVRPLAETRELNKPITFETLHGPKKRVNFNGSPAYGLSWLKDGEHYAQVRDGKTYKVHAVSGRSKLAFEPNELAEGLKRLPGMDEKSARSLSRRTRFTTSPDQNAVLIDYENDLYYCTLDGKEALRLTSSPAAEKYSTFDAGGKFVAFVRDQNLYVVDIATQTERALTDDGGGDIANGEADWVYYEEVFRRRQVFWWSADSSVIAFLQFDDAPVNKFTLVDSLQKNQQLEQSPYPRAGEPNPNVRLGVVSVAGGPVRWAELDDYLQGSYLITGVGWMPDSERIYFFVQDRAQTWLDFNTVSERAGQPRRLFRETTEAWVDVPPGPTFLSDGSFLLLSERTGWKHVYLYDKEGRLQHAVTSGEWEARRIDHVDQEQGWVYLSATRDSHVAENLYRVKRNGSDMERLTKAPGEHRVSVSPNGKYFIDWWSNSSTPTKVTLYATDGTQIRMLDTNPVYEREEYRFGEYEQFQIETADGFLLEASLIKPPDFDPDKKYPVWFMTYGGPHAPTIRDGWGGGRARDQMLAQMGMLVFRCDPRSASGKGACSTWTAYKELGVQELKDMEEAIGWLRSRPYVDPNRIGMSGHSYGGFMTAYALTHSKLFAGGIAGAPVTDWHLYDTIYTERYMDTPQDNPQGYEKTSVVKAAKNLHGKLLMVHGARDDNVHLENTFKLVHALQQANKDFQLMIYPQSRHGIGPMHYRRLQVDFIKQVLQLTEPRS